MDYIQKLEEVLGSPKLMPVAPPPPVMPQPVKAPPRPVPKREPKPSRPVPQREPKPPEPQPRDPFKPKPTKTPAPEKAQLELEEQIQAILEAYEEEADPELVKFWKELPKGGHVYSKHPILALLGHQLAAKAFEWLDERVARLAAKNPREVHRAFMRIERLEEDNREELEELAKDLVVDAWGVPREILSAELTADVKFKPGEQEPEGLEEPEDLEPEEPAAEEIKSKPELSDLINKRITMNALIQGSAVHNMMTLHHLAKEELDKIDPQLTNFYDKFAAGSAHGYSMMNIAAIAATNPQAAIGAVYVDDSEPMIYARARNFPVLLQELVKGVVELISRHGLAGLDASTLKKIYNAADHYADEPYLIQVGPQLWRSLLAIIPKGKRPADIIAALSVLPPKELHDLLTKAIEEPEEAKESLQEVLEKDEEAQGLKKSEWEETEEIRIFVSPEGEIYDEAGEAIGHLNYEINQYESHDEMAGELSERLELPLMPKAEHEDGILEFGLQE